MAVKDTDVMTTVVGAVSAVAMAAGPVLSQVQPGTSMHPQDWTQLVAAVFVGLLGWFSNKKGTQNG